MKKIAKNALYIFLFFIAFATLKGFLSMEKNAQRQESLNKALERSMSTANSANDFESPECGLKVTFPSKPDKVRLQITGMSFAERAQLTIHQGAIKATCLVRDDALSSAPLTDEIIKSEAEHLIATNGYENTEYQITDSPYGRKLVLKAHKTAAGLNVIIKHEAYYIWPEMFSLAVISDSESYPRKEFLPYLNSVSKLE
jgi:hypothetical protein